MRLAYEHFLRIDTGADSFWRCVIDSFKLSVKTYGNGADSIPASGPLLIVANHPFGVIDGAAVAWLLSTRRRDFKVILWDVFDQTVSGRDFLLPMDPVCRPSSIS